MWKEVNIIKSNGLVLQGRENYINQNLSNILYIQTPVASVFGVSQQVYEPLANKGYNIYAIDLTGIGRSDGNISDFSTSQILDYLDTVIDYIEKRSLKPIFLYASTGIGGICGQYFISNTNRISAFAQYGVGIYKDLSPMKMSIITAKISYVILNILSKIVPNLKIKVSPPKYYGKNKELDDLVYAEYIKENPKLFYANINWIKTMLEIFINEKSNLKHPPNCPTLVFKVNYDRYFTKAYFDKYFESLNCDKKLVEIDDVHNSYYLQADNICNEVIKWFDNYNIVKTKE